MKILQINTVCGTGSTGRIAVDIQNILKKNGHEGYIAYGRGKANCENNIKIGDKKDFYFHAVKTRLFDKHGFGSKKSTLDFIKKVKKIKPDIIHLHNIHGYYINIEILFQYLKESSIPVVWTLHDCWAFTGHCSHFDYANCYKWRRYCEKCPEKGSYPKSILVDNSYKNFEVKKLLFTDVNNLVIVTPSKWLADLVKCSFLNSFEVKVINNGIDLEVFKPTESDFRLKNSLENCFLILGVASVWSRRKGLEYFLKLSEKISEDEKIILIGLSKKQINLLPKNIIGIEKTNNVKELAEIYSSVDVFANPTLEETFPTTNLEALACGTPIVVFDSGGASESVDNSTGFIVKKGDIEDLYLKIKTVKMLSKNYFSCKCIKKAIENYDKNKKFQEYLALYGI